MHGYSRNLKSEFRKRHQVTHICWRIDTDKNIGILLHSY